MTTNSSKNDEGLKVEITEDMVFEAAKFGNDYYQNPAKRKIYQQRKIIKTP